MYKLNSITICSTLVYTVNIKSDNILQYFFVVIDYVNLMCWIIVFNTPNVKFLLSQVQNSSASMDFFSATNNVLIAEGLTTAQGSMIVINDAIPEGNETFLLRIIEARFGAGIGPMDTMLLTVQASDEPFGKFQFTQVRGWTRSLATLFFIMYNPTYRTLCQ